MPRSTGNILEQLGSDALPFGVGAGAFFAGNFFATGSVLEAAEIGFLAGFGAGIAITGVVVVGAVAVPVGIALALGNNKLAGELTNAIHEVTPLLSPGVIGLLPVSPLFTPGDPTLFARGVGPGFDLVAGAFSGTTTDKIGAELSGLAGFQGWKSDVINLGNSYFSSQSPSGSSPGQAPSPVRPSPGPTPAPSAGDGHPSSGGLSFDFTAPGDGDTDSNTPSGNNYSDIPTFTMTIELNDMDGAGAAGAGNTTGNASGEPAESQPASNDTSGSDESGGQEAGPQSGGDGQTNEGSGGENEGGGGEESGGSEGDSGGGSED